MCGKKTLKNQQCWLQDVSCGQVCGKTLRCGSHFCRKPCHKAGECEDANGVACSQPCGKEKKICGHPHQEATCHAPFACKEDTPCLSKIYITCKCQAQKQEMKCGASKNSEGNGSKSLPCNDECARLERNRKLALALNIDQSSHIDGGDHIPYSADTLNHFAEHVKWAQTHEREFRVFATSDDEKRLRFKPMQAHQRAFIHSLAEDFGLDSESMDAEPHRHVMIWKTPRFVSAPNKTLAEALRIRQAARSLTASANVSDNEGTATAAKKGKSSNEVGEPYNAFLLTNPRFGLTVDEIRAEILATVHPSTPIIFDIEFLPNEDVVLKAHGRSSGPPLPAHDLENTLQNLRTPLATAMTLKNYGNVQLCSTDTSLNILRRESDHVAGDGWSKVAAAKKAAPRFLTQPGGFGGSNTFAALAGGNKVTFAKKAVRPEKERVVKAPPPPPPPLPVVVVEDWEAAEIAEEERERGSSGDEVEGGGRGSGVGEMDRPSKVLEGAEAEDAERLVEEVTTPGIVGDETGGLGLATSATEVGAETSVLLDK